MLRQEHLLGTMRILAASFRRIATVLLCGSFVSVAGLATTTGSISATAGANSCSQSGANVSCNVSAPGNTLSGPVTASASVIDTWDYGGGKLEVTTDGYGFGTSATGSVSYSNMLIVNGASGSGDLTFNFTGFEDILSAPPAGGMVSPLTVKLGANSTTVNFPGSGSFSATLPVTFGVLVPFTISFSDSASGTMFMNETYGRGDADAALTTFPTFVVTSVTGAPIPATVGIAPEPQTFGLLVAAIVAFGLVRTSTRRERA